MMFWCRGIDFEVYIAQSGEIERIGCEIEVTRDILYIEGI